MINNILNIKTSLLRRHNYRVVPPKLKTTQCVSSMWQTTNRNKNNLDTVNTGGRRQDKLQGQLINFYQLHKFSQVTMGSESVSEDSRGSYFSPNSALNN